MSGAREIARARRSNQPVSVLVMDIDEYDELYDHYGEVRGHFVLKKVAVPKKLEPFEL